ncbi:Lrp/AsnC family transcriptional regulator [Hyalangium sp.]|uniref:Lrp/AsnC family transcriptional regulator n=1 Tax=Hyalangium sp. TaxID=2028555 RepID=UPI002D37CB6C|nr:Lrp/AsnC family transcriptional regulator [Hyalangium sp.]HYI00101.1 Lrp/AsnC family transcriptional regulator [Hyalangium sp.]
MDSLDYRILDMLQRDGRATQLEISRAIGLSQPAVAERIRKLEDRGVITGYTARVDATKLGKDITAFIGVNIEHPKYFENFANKVMGLPEVLEAHRVAGQESYILKVKTANTRTLDQLLVETLRTISGVTGTHTTIVLTSIKEETHVQVSPEQLKGD